MFDAIVIGSGMSGGWAAKELTEKGLKTLLIESGRNVEHIKDYPTTNMQPWEFAHRGTVPYQTKQLYKTVNKHYIFDESTLHFLKKDARQEYIQEKPFDWIRGDQVGGRSLLWARHTQRWSDYDFEGPLRDGFAVDWPIRYKDLAPWYSHVEKFIGISGNRDGLDVLPDGEFLPPFDMTCAEKHLQSIINKTYTDRNLIIARVAHLTSPTNIHLQQGRGKCQNRDLCARGCPFGGYFSSNSSTIPWAQKTGNLTLITDAMVHSIVYDEHNKKATGVKVIDTITQKTEVYSAKIIFVNASALGTNSVLLNSTSSRFPNGIGNDNGLLGKFVGFHNYRGKVSAEFDGLKEFTTDGRRPGASFMPRFRNVHKQETDFLRGYNTVIGSNRPHIAYREDYGEALKNNIDSKAEGKWQIYAQMMGETIPKITNMVSLDPVKKDSYGIPQLRVNVTYDDNDEKMLQDFFAQFTEMFNKAGFSNIETKDTKRNPGNENHEMGGVRMGHDPKTSLINKWNQLHACPNVFVTDGACMTSMSSQNPSLTYMALTARAANYAADEVKKGNL
ncbi:GMC family oxidoreductase [Pedobacter frigiditerrae]|uniref:GMC family oxidoreductase n=1 Tax=Pedobacter frigiditerrae TaxID=2530452 RepID=A0A4R0MPB5_9SPHI|nr:GMC family oxidoreductase [Pedobacter frigiditerrae]TCC88689.1 GMC family oxidoreductase [Pedobacter frigiditerrae]